MKQINDMTDAKMKTKYNILILIFCAISIYCLAYLSWYWTTELGMAPVLDGAENIALAEQISKNQLPSEPFYRAMLYPAILSVFFRLGLEIDSIPIIVGILGFLLHIANTSLVGWISHITFKKSICTQFATLIYGFYPVLIFFFAQPLDITAGITFALLTVVFLLKSYEAKSISYGIFSGFFLGLGTMLRSNILVLAACYLLSLFNKKLRLPAATALISLFFALIAGGLVNFHHSGEFKILPWQGAFVFYSSNASHANGKYFNQTVYISEKQPHENPARIESEILYKKHTNKREITDIDEFNRFWKNKTFSQIKQNPLNWLQLKLKKTYYFFNNFEQYNNKTYIFHKQRSPILRHNPLNWAIVFILATISVFNLKLFNLQFKQIILSFLLLAAGTIAFLVSARFRILTLPFLVVIASGIFCISKSQLFKPKNIILLLLSSLLVFSNFFNVQDLSTLPSDYLLLAQSNAKIFDFKSQYYWADKTLKKQPNNLNAIRLKLTAFTNLVLTNEAEEHHSWKNVIKQLDFLEHNNLFFDDTAFIQGCFHIKHKDTPQKAKQIWEKALETTDQPALFLAMLLITNNIHFNKEMLNYKDYPLMRYALIRKGLVEKSEKDKLQGLHNTVHNLIGKH